jgi:hypothetical protein
MLLRGRDTPAGMTITLRKKKLRKYDMYLYVDALKHPNVSIESPGWISDDFPQFNIPINVIHSSHHDISEVHIKIIGFFENLQKISIGIDDKENTFDYYTTNHEYFDLIRHHYIPEVETTNELNFDVSIDFSSLNDVKDSFDYQIDKITHSIDLANFYFENYYIKNSTSSFGVDSILPTDEIIEFYFRKYNKIINNTLSKVYNVTQSGYEYSPISETKTHNLYTRSFIFDEYRQNREEVERYLEYSNKNTFSVNKDFINKDDYFDIISITHQSLYEMLYEDEIFDTYKTIFNEYLTIESAKIVKLNPYNYLSFATSISADNKNQALSFTFSNFLTKLEEENRIYRNYSTVSKYLDYKEVDNYKHVKQIVNVSSVHIKDINSDSFPILEIFKETIISEKKSKHHDVEHNRFLYSPDFYRPFTLHLTNIRNTKRLPPKQSFLLKYKQEPRKSIRILFSKYNKKKYKFIIGNRRFYNKFIKIKFASIERNKVFRFFYVSLANKKCVPFNISKLKNNSKFKNTLLDILYNYSFKNKHIPIKRIDANFQSFIIKTDKKINGEIEISFRDKFGQGAGANGSIWSGYSKGNIINAFRKWSTFVDGPRGLKQDYEKAIKWIKSKTDYYALRGINVQEALDPIHVLESKINPFNRKVIGPYIESSLLKRFNFGAKHRSLGYYREKEIPMPKFSNISQYRPQTNKIKRTIDITEYKAFKFFNQQEIPIADKRYKFATDFVTGNKLPLSLKTNFIDYDAKPYEIPRIEIMKRRNIRNDVVYGMFGETIDYFSKKPIDSDKYIIDTGSKVKVHQEPDKYDEYGNYIGSGGIYVDIPIKTYALNISEDFMFEYDITYRVRKNWSLQRDSDVIEDSRDDGEVNQEPIESRLRRYIQNGWLSLDDYDGYITISDSGEIEVHDDLVKEIDLLSEASRFVNEEELMNILGSSLKTIIQQRAEKRRGNT